MNILPLPEAQIEEIRQYLSGQASEALREKIEAQIASDPAFGEEVEAIRFLMQGLKTLHVQDMRTQVAQWEAERKQAENTEALEQSSQKHTAKIITFFQRHRYATLAAVILLLLLPLGRWVLHLQTPAKNYDELLAENLVEVPMPSLMRGGKASADSLETWYHAGLSYYVMEQYKEAAFFLSKCADHDSLPAGAHAEDVQLFLAVSHLQLGETDRAKERLSSMSDSNMYSGQKEWFLALTSLQAKDTLLLAKQLHTIAQDSQHPYEEKAKGLLEALPK